MSRYYNSPQDAPSVFPTHPILRDLKSAPHRGIYFTKFLGATPIWFRMNNEKWEWTPYDPEHRHTGVIQHWYPVNTTVVPEGSWKGEEPVPKNCAIICELLKWQTSLKKKEQAKTNLFTLTDGTKIEIALKNGYKQFVPTNASAALDSVLQMITTGWMPKRPVVISLFGSPGTGKNEMVRRFAEQLWQFFVQEKKGKQNFTKFPNFFKEHNFATLPNKEAISKFVGTSRGIEGGKGDLVIDLTNRAQVFYLDEFEKADPAIIKAFGGLFEDGEITDNSGAYARCISPTFFFISGNYSSEQQEKLAKTITELPAFLKTNDQSHLEDADLELKWKEFKEISFSGNLAFIGDRVFLTLLTYQPKSLDFCGGIATKFLHDAAAQIEGKYLIGWRPSLVQYYAKRMLQSHFSNRHWRSQILRDMLHSLRRLRGETQTQTLQNKIVIFSAEGQFELFEVNPEMKRIAEGSKVLEEWTPQTKAEIEENVAIGQDNPREITVSSKSGKIKYIYKYQTEPTAPAPVPVPVEDDPLVPTLLGMIIIISLAIISAQIIF